MKVQVKSYFRSHKNNKKADRLCKNFSSTSNTSVQRCLYLLFQNQRPHFLLIPLFWRISQPSGSINKMVNEHAVSYHLSSSELTSRIHPLIFSWTLKWFITPEYLYILPSLQKSFEFTVLRLLEETFASQKIDSIRFCSCPQAEVNYPFQLNSIFWKPIFP